MRARVKRKVIRRLPKKLKGAKSVKAGFPIGINQDIVDRAVYNNNGTDKIPPRPFMDNAYLDNRDDYQGIIKKSAKNILRGDEKPIKSLRILGIKMQIDIQDEIRNLRDPENSDITIAKKGSSNPLIDTGEMRQSVTWEVNND